MTNPNEELLGVQYARSAVLHNAYETTRTYDEFVEHLQPIMTISVGELEVAWNLLDYIEDNFNGDH